MSLVEDFDAFPNLRKYKTLLEKSEEIRESVQRMLSLIQASCEYFCNHTQQGYFGNGLDRGVGYIHYGDKWRDYSSYNSPD